MFKTALTALSLVAAAATASAETWQMSAHDPDANYLTQNDKLFAEDVERLSGGALKIEVIGNAALLSRADLKRGVQRGIVPIGEVLISALGNEDPIFNADSVPFLARTYDEATALWAATRPLYEEKLAEQGLKILYAAPFQPQGVYMSKEVISADDFKGLPFRAYNAATAQFATLLGAVPANIASSEVPQAFSTGVIEGMITSPAMGVDSQSWDYLSHFYDIRAFVPKNMVIVNQKAFDKLPAEVKDAVMEAARLAEARGWEMSEATTDQAIKTMAEHGIHILQAPAALETALGPIAATMLDDWKAAAGDEAQTVLQAYQH